MPAMWDFDVYRADKKLLDSDGVDKKLIALKNMKISENAIEHDSEAKSELARAAGQFSSAGHLFCAKVEAGHADGKHSHEHAFMVLRLLHPDPDSGHRYFYVGRIFETNASVPELLATGWSGAATHNGTFHSPI